MRLRSITLQGFKSFAESATVKVLPGITGIVGPNGCGKSNIAEAVRWALGEQSARSLRGHRMEDLIFHGSASRRAIGLAEVELTFENDGALPVAWTEVAVSRRLYRTGESEYLLNGSPSRLRDILDLFAGTGASPRAYSVMDQEKLNHVLTARPHERRIFIEEAAGIARYKQQRGETQGKLDAARQNLARVRDVMDEVRRQLGSLERQARRAQQYKALQAERQDLALVLLAADHAALAAEGARLAAGLEEIRDRESGLRAHLGALAAREAHQRAGLLESDHRVADLRQAVQKVQGDLERLLERREQLGVQIRELTEEAARLEEDVRAGAARASTLVEEREAARLALAGAEVRAAERTAAARQLEEAIEHQRASLARERERLEALRITQVRVATERTELMRATGEQRERRTQLARRAERLAVELEELHAEATRLVETRACLETARDRTVAEIHSLGAERARLADLLAAAQERLGAAESRGAELRLTLAARRSSLEALSALERAREGYSAGVRAIFTEGRGAVLPGVVGTVADLLEVPAGLERAMEAVLGERLEWVVVQQFEHARAAVDYLRECQAGAATFLPLAHLPAPPAAAPPPEGPAPGAPAPVVDGVEWAVRRVSAPDPGLVHYLLGRVAVVEHLDRAESLWRKNGVVATYVTPSGEVLSPTGRLRGGAEIADAPVDRALLTRKRHLRELEEDVQRLQRDLEATRDIVAAVGADVATLRARLPLVEQAIHTRQAERLASEKDLEQAAREHERAHRHGETIDREARQVAAEATETDLRLGELDARLELAREAEARHETDMSGLRRSIDLAREHETTLLAELTSCQVERAAAAERVEAIRRELQHLDGLDTDLRRRLEQARQRRAQVAERSAWLAGEERRTDADGAATAVERDRIEEDSRVAAERHEGLAAALRALQAEIREVEGELARLTQSAHDLELRATEGRVRREELLDEARRTFGVDEAGVGERHDPLRDLGPVRERLSELEERLGQMGPVNLVADEEYRELGERLAFLRAQHDDLVGSIKDLEKALRGMTRTAQERFLQAFEAIDAQFRQIFERLFEGGRAELRLVEPEEGGDPLDAGVELMAQPRGKRLQSVTLLSGGERALTGLALLFGIFYHRPSPFCILDEVDAPLDDANIHRFLRVLGELTSQTQFLVITHNRKTMEAADVLYGVTMEEPGLSKLVSVRLHGPGGLPGLPGPGGPRG
jgi:chromosome segregation protein